MFKVNPYRPGTGLMPTYLADRDEDIENVEQMFHALIMNVPTQSIIFSGLRGVGKTVLINKLHQVYTKNTFPKFLQELHFREVYIPRIVFLQFFGIMEADKGDASL